MASALAVTTLVKDVQTATVKAAPDAILPAPTPPPSYQQPISVPMNPNPTAALPPEGQHMGKGGTSFGAMPITYDPPVIIFLEEQGYWVNNITNEIVPGLRTAQPSMAAGWAWSAQPPVDYVPPRRPGVTVPKPELIGYRPGEDATMPVLYGPVPTRTPAGKVTESVTPPKGPITGKVGAFDLSTVPTWVWLVGAAFLGSRLLK